MLVSILLGDGEFDVGTFIRGYRIWYPFRFVERALVFLKGLDGGTLE